jgi:hypothetical protein
MLAQRGFAENISHIRRIAILPFHPTSKEVDRECLIVEQSRVNRARRGADSVANFCAPANVDRLPNH